MMNDKTGAESPGVDIGEIDALKKRLAFLEQAGAVLTSSLDYGRTLSEVARLAVPLLADWCAVDIVDDAGVLRRLAAAHIDPSREPGVFELAERVRLEVSRPDSRTTRAMIYDEPQLLEPEFFDWIREQAADPVARRLLEMLTPTSGIIVGIRARGRALGVLIFLRSEGGPAYAEADLLLAKEIADRGALAIDNALLHAQAQSAVQARDLLATVAHDLKSPLNGIVLCAHVLERAVDESGLLDRVHRKAREILNGAGHMSRLIDDLLAGTRLEDGRLELDVEACPPARLVEEALAFAGPMAEEKSLQLAASVDDGVPDVRCDPHRLLQVLSNLIDNAVKFTPEGGTITVGIETEADAVVFSVRDSGPGIPADALGRIFDRLWQVGPQKSAGTGLGLFIARGIVEAHGGRIWAESEAGSGSRFYFTLPTTGR